MKCVPPSTSRCLTGARAERRRVISAASRRRERAELGQTALPYLSCPRKRASRMQSELSRLTAAGGRLWSPAFAGVTNSARGIVSALAPHKLDVRSLPLLHRARSPSPDHNRL